MQNKLNSCKRSPRIAGQFVGQNLFRSANHSILAFWMYVLGDRSTVLCVFNVIFSVETHSVATDGETHTQNEHRKRTTKTQV
jgi:hypothetical protein